LQESCSNCSAQQFSNLTWCESEAYLRELPCVAVATAPAIVWSMNQLQQQRNKRNDKAGHCYVLQSFHCIAYACYLMRGIVAERFSQQQLQQHCCCSSFINPRESILV
jgi:hypothetical protein